jgi:hypothetical protein
MRTADEKLKEILDVVNELPDPDYNDGPDYESDFLEAQSRLDKIREIINEK